jgi:hypothetical protein
MNRFASRLDNNCVFNDIGLTVKSILQFMYRKPARTCPALVLKVQIAWFGGKTIVFVSRINMYLGTKKINYRSNPYIFGTNNVASKPIRTLVLIMPRPVPFGLSKKNRSVPEGES